MMKNKFRVWSKKRKDWLTSDDHSLHCSSNWMMNIFTGEIIDFTLVGDEYRPDPEPLSYCNGTKIFKESPFVVQQWTGLQDINDQDIYEGDILNYTISNHKFTDRVVWQNNGWALLSLNDDSGYPISASYRPKIIGNIFENSDLLNTTL